MPKTEVVLLSCETKHGKADLANTPTGKGNGSTLQLYYSFQERQEAYSMALLWRRVQNSFVVFTFLGGGLRAVAYSSRSLLIVSARIRITFEHRSI
jgi:hypothetical protein